MIHIQAVSKTYHDGATVAVDRLSLQVAAGELLVLLGASGCGQQAQHRAEHDDRQQVVNQWRLPDDEIVEVWPPSRPPRPAAGQGSGLASSCR